MIRWLHVLAQLGIVLSTLSGQNFAELSAALGVEETYGDGFFGGGLSLADFTGDGLSDLSITTENGKDLLFYVNQGNGSFLPFPNPISNLQETKEINWIDYDNDGDLDLYFTVLNGVNRLVRNNGGSFTEVTNQAFGPNPPSLSTYGCAWGDYDRDGDLDLFICNRVFTPSSVRDELWRNNGNGSFTEVSATALIGNQARLTFDAVFTDLNQDGWPDLYLAVDREFDINATFINQGDGTLVLSSGNGADLGIDAMNAGGADYDNDGDFDLYVTNTSDGNFLLANDGNAQFTDVTGSTGVGAYRFCWAATFFDFDNDTDQDLYVSASTFGGNNGTNPFLVNIGNGIYFEPLWGDNGLGGIDNQDSYSHAVADLNSDGLLDIVSLQAEPDSIQIWQNQENNVNNWIKISLTGVQSNSRGIGAVISLDLPSGERLSRYLTSSQGYLSQAAQSAHFGLGSASSLTAITVAWPSGTVDRIESFSNLNQGLNITEGSFALPLELLDFQVNWTSLGRLLRWETEWERGTDQFVVERSFDGRSFHNTATLEASGNSHELVQYSFLDRDPIQAEQVYYRLKMIDLDDQYRYSPLRRLTPPNIDPSTPFQLIGELINPVVDQRLNIRCHRLIPGDLRVGIFNAAGQQLIAQKMYQEIGEHAVSVSIAELPAGLYWLRLASGNYELVREILVR